MEAWFVLLIQLFEAANVDHAQRCSLSVRPFQEHAENLIVHVQEYSEKMSRISH